MSDLTMSDLTMVANDHDFTPLHAAMQRYVDQEILAGVSTAVLSGRDLVDVHYTGFSDREAAVPLVEGHIFRAYSNTKLMVSCAALLALEDGHFKMDDPIETYIPALGNRQVLRQGATDITDTEPAASSITIRHLLSHSSGLSNGFLEPDSLITQTYTAHKVNDPDTTLAQMMDILGELPLTFHPGKAWGYSVALDVIGRLVEIVSGQTLDEFLQKRIFDPLGMVDTGFFVPPEKQDRLAVFYAGADLMEPMKGGLTPVNATLLDINPLKKSARLSGAGGLVTTLPDMVALIRALLPGEDMLLQPRSMDLIKTPQVAKGINLFFPARGEIAGKAYSAAGAVTFAPNAFDPAQSTGELQWGGVGGTHWWFLPEHNIAGIVMTQRVMAFWHPFAFEFKKLTYDALLG